MPSEVLLQFSATETTAAITVSAGETVEIICRRAVERRALVDKLLFPLAVDHLKQVSVHLEAANIGVVSNPPLLISDLTIERAMEMGAFPDSLKDKLYALNQADWDIDMSEKSLQEYVGDIGLERQLHINFAMALLRNPKMLVIDGLLDDQSKNVKALAAHFEDSYRRRFPLRTVCYLVDEACEAGDDVRRIVLPELHHQ